MSDYNKFTLNGVLLIILVGILFIDALVLERHPQSHYLGPATTKKCENLNPEKGSGNLRTNGSTVFFTCLYGFDLYGERYGLCRDCVCNVPTPVCTRLGCRLMPRLGNGTLYYPENGAVVLYFCEPGYKLQGSKLSYCNGYKWNSTLPKCVPTDVLPSTSCDFESDDICDWTVDQMNSDQWFHVNRKIPRGINGSGPAHDHSFEGKPIIGHYMYVEGSARSNSSARLISPLYSSDLTVSACLHFYYHMYGRHTGILRVLMKPQNLDIESIEDDKDLLEKYVLFEISGNQGDVWHQHNSSLVNKTKQNFQIVVEAFGGSGYLSNIAIDDISIFRGEKCGLKLPGIVDVDEIYFPNFPFGIDTCEDRCFENRTAASKNGCQCYIGCLKDDQCCADYIDLCIMSNAFPNVDETEIIENDKTNVTIPLHDLDSCVNITDLTNKSALVIATGIPLLILFITLLEIFIRGHNSIFLKIRRHARCESKILKRNQSGVRFVQAEESTISGIDLEERRISY